MAPPPNPAAALLDPQAADAFAAHLHSELRRGSYQPCDSDTAVIVYTAVLSWSHGGTPVAVETLTPTIADVPLGDVAATLAQLPTKTPHADSVLQALAAIAAAPHIGVSSETDVDLAAAAYPHLWTLSRNHTDSVLTQLQNLADSSATPSLCRMVATTAHLLQTLQAAPGSSGGRPAHVIAAVAARTLATRLEQILLGRPLIPTPPLRDLTLANQASTEGPHATLTELVDSLTTTLTRRTWQPTQHDRHTAERVIATVNEPAYAPAWRIADAEIAHRGWRCALSAALHTHAALLAAADTHLSDLLTLAYRALWDTNTDYEQMVTTVWSSCNTVVAIARNDVDL